MRTMPVKKEKAEEFQMLQQQLEMMQKYTEELDEKLAEYTKKKESITEMKQLKDAQLFVPVASGIFAKVKVSQFDEALVAVGANTAVTKSVPQLLTFLDRQIRDVEEVKAQIAHSIGNITERADALLTELHGTVQQA